MSRLSREAFIRQFDTNPIELTKLESQPDLSEGVKASLRVADLDRDGSLGGRTELNQAFTRLDNYDRDGSRNTIEVRRNGQETALGRVVNALNQASLTSTRSSSTTSSDIQVALESVRRGLVTLNQGDRGGTVRALQTALSELGYTASIDGDFGPQTQTVLKAFQRANGLATDGIAGPNTATAILAALQGQSSSVITESSTTPSVSNEEASLVSWQTALEQLSETGATLREGGRGADVQALQAGLIEQGVSLDADGIFGPATRRALQSYQWSRGLTADGIAGPQTYQALLTGAPEIERLEPTPSNGNPIDLFPVAGGQFNVGYDSNWNNFDYRTAYHNSDFSLTATDVNHPNGHLGVDVFAPLDAPIVAPVAGEVVKAGYSSIGGYHVTIRRGDVYYYHAHLNNVSPNIRPGMMVAAGEFLGGNGNSGVVRGTEPHLHFSMYRGAGGYYRDPINPFSALNDAIIRGSVMG